MNPPNLITIARIVLTPAVWWMVMSPGVTLRLIGWVVFLAAALSDIWDGYLARKHGWITDFGKLFDPLADKLLLVVTLVPTYLLSQPSGVASSLGFIDRLPIWVLAVIFGREVLVTLLRQIARRRGSVIAAGIWGKRKALAQNLFVGGTLLWFPLAQLALDRGWLEAPAWKIWSGFHGTWNLVTLGLAVGLSVYSLAEYFWRHRRLFGLK